jgi:hypothetical protein
MTRKYWNIDLEEMMEAGVHFGHGTRKWNPRMAPYISAKRKGMNITNLTRTARFLSEACDLVFDAASRGKHFLIVGTKNQAADSVASAARRARRGEFNELAPMVDPFLNPRVTEAQGPHQPEAESTSGDESSSSVEEYAENSHSSGTAEAEAPMFNEDPLPQFRLAHLAEEEALVTRVRVLEGQLGYFVLPQEEEGGYEKLLLGGKKINQRSYEWNGFSRGRHWTWSVWNYFKNSRVDKFLRDPCVYVTANPTLCTR